MKPSSNYVKPGVLLDPRAAIICAVLFSVTIAIQNVVPVTFLGFIIALFLFAAVKCKPVEVIKRLLIVNVFVLFIALFLPWSVEGSEIFSVFSVGITREGISQTLLIALKANAIVLVTTSLLQMFDIAQIARASCTLGLPVKLSLMFSVMARYVFQIRNEYNRIRRAALLRGFSIALTKNTLHTLSEMLGTMIISSTRRGEQVQNAMLLRGFSKASESHNDMTFKFRDLIFITVSALLLLLGIAVIL